IRDRNVTGVQTCALPISVTSNSGDGKGCDGSDGQGLTGSGGKSKHVDDSFDVGGRKKAWVDAALLRSFVTDDIEANGQGNDETRSEERRVGKACGEERTT